MDFDSLDISFWIKFGICFGAFVIIPVWFFKIVDLSLFYKLMFTVAGGVGAFIALTGKSIKYGKNR